jgi:uncharacterized membrane protein YadS
VLYGLRLTVQDIGHVVGLSGVGIDALVLGSTFALACWIETRWLNLVRFICLVAGGALINRGVPALLGCAAA